MYHSSCELCGQCAGGRNDWIRFWMTRSIRVESCNEEIGWKRGRTKEGLNTMIFTERKNGQIWDS